MTTSTDFLEALQRLPKYEAAKIVTDYIEEGKQLNLDRMKEIFMTKDDKIELIDRIAKVQFACVKWYLIIGSVQTGTILGFLYFMLKNSNPK